MCVCVCVSDFGFSQSSFSGREQGESYKVQVKFFSGGGEITTGFIFFLSLDLSGTASKYDNNYQCIFNNDYYITSKHYVVSRSICKVVDT